MKLAFALLLMTTTLSVGSTVLAGPSLPRVPEVGLLSFALPDAALTLIDGDEDEKEGDWFQSRLDDDDDDEGDDDDDDDDDCGDDEQGEDCAAGVTGNAAKAGTAPPPKNGLFTNGTAPVVTSN